MASSLYTYFANMLRMAWDPHPMGLYKRRRQLIENEKSHLGSSMD